jgi:hypothetical protein
MNPLPTGFWLCLGFAVLGTGVVLTALWALLRRAPVLSRARRVFSDARASSIVEFPFALLSLTLITLLTSQLVFMASAYLVVDYAAYAAVRCAIVSVPEDRSADDNDEPVGKVKKLNLEDGSKGEDIHDAAVFCCVPISGTAIGGVVTGIESLLNNLVDLPGNSGFLEMGGPLAWVDRYAYARKFTKVQMVAEGEGTDEKEFGPNDLLTVGVTHHFQLLVPVADKVFGRPMSQAGRVTSLGGKASMMNEGYPGEEKKPEGAPE